MYQLHIGNKNYSSWSLRPWVLLSQLGIPFEAVQHFFNGGYGKNPHFKDFSPNGMVPCLSDGDLAVWDSLAIAEYETFAQVWPSDKSARAFARSAAAEMHAGFSQLRTVCTMTCGQRIRLKAITPALKTDLARLETLWAEGLERFGGPFLAGDQFSAVDAFFCPVAFRVQTYDLPLSAPAKAYIDRLLGLEAMQSWYQAALAETQRDPDHEDDIPLYGDVIADYRA
jgi:glutathione S-transferase